MTAAPPAPNPLGGSILVVAVVAAAAVGLGAAAVYVLRRRRMAQAQGGDEEQSTEYFYGVPVVFTGVGDDRSFKIVYMEGLEVTSEGVPSDASEIRRRARADVESFNAIFSPPSLDGVGVQLYFNHEYPDSAPWAFAVIAPNGWTYLRGEVGSPTPTKAKLLGMQKAAEVKDLVLEWNDMWKVPAVDDLLREYNDAHAAEE